MKVEIWSDVVCPWCYIGKRRFEAALEQFSGKDEVEIEWKSFQLNPDIKSDASKKVSEHLAAIKGWNEEQAKGIYEHVTNVAKEVGLHYNFDEAVISNTFDAHRLIQLAKHLDKGDQIEERLFQAYFTEGKNIGDRDVLTSLGVEIGIEESRIQELFSSDLYSDHVNLDQYESQQMGCRGVPFFVIDRKYGISGAQPSEVFLDALNQAVTD